MLHRKIQHLEDVWVGFIKMVPSPNNSTYPGLGACAWIVTIAQSAEQAVWNIENVVPFYGFTLTTVDELYSFPEMETEDKQKKILRTLRRHARRTGRTIMGTPHGWLSEDDE